MIKSEIKLIRSLDDKRNRMEQGLFVAEGEKLISEIGASHLRVRKIYALEGVFEGCKGLNRAEIEVVSRAEMERISFLKTASNSLALVEIPHYTLEPRQLKQQLTLALDDVQNPGNLGTIIRLADWYGISDILCSPATADCFNPKVVQATMGAILRVRLHYGPLSPVLERAAADGVAIYGTFLDGKNIYESDLRPNGILVMGNEGQGVTAAVAQRVTHRLLIPPYPADRRTTESLNVAMATGILCAEFRRRAHLK